MAAHPPSYYEKRWGTTIDKEMPDIPTTDGARQYMENRRVRFHLRTPAEGIKDEKTTTPPGTKTTRPSQRKESREDRFGMESRGFNNTSAAK